MLNETVPFPDKLCESLRCVFTKKPYWLSLEEFIFGGPNSFIARYTD